MYKLVLIRHGESTWNLENRLHRLDRRRSDADRRRAGQAGRPAAEGRGLRLRRGLHLGAEARGLTLWHTLDQMDRTWLPVVHSWRLNEPALRFAAGAQQGRHGEAVRRRAGADLAPQLRHAAAGARCRRPARQRQDIRYAKLRPEDVPLTECLKDTVTRVLPFWNDSIAPAIKAGKRIVIAAHGNSIRALVKYLDGIADADIVGVNIPNGIPLVYELDENLKPIKSYYLGDAEAAAAAAAAVANQGRKA